MERLPYRFLGIVASIEGDPGMCTGTLISPNLVLSSASFCFSRHLQKTSENKMCVYEKPNENKVFLIQRLGVVRSYKVESCFFPP